MLGIDHERFEAKNPRKKKQRFVNAALGEFLKSNGQFGSRNKPTAFLKSCGQSCSRNKKKPTAFLKSRGQSCSKEMSIAFLKSMGEEMASTIGPGLGHGGQSAYAVG